MSLTFRVVLLALFGAGLIAAGLSMGHNASSPYDAGLSEIIARLDGFSVALRAPNPTDKPRISRAEAVKAAGHSRMRVRNTVLARGDVGSRLDILVWVVDYDPNGEESESCGPLGGTCRTYRTEVAVSLVDADTGESFGTFEEAVPIT